MTILLQHAQHPDASNLSEWQYHQQTPQNGILKREQYLHRQQSPAIIAAFEGTPVHRLPAAALQLGIAASTYKLFVDPSAMSR